MSSHCHATARPPMTSLVECYSFALPCTRRKRNLRLGWMLALVLVLVLALVLLPLMVLALVLMVAMMS